MKQVKARQLLPGRRSRPSRRTGTGKLPFPINKSCIYGSRNIVVEIRKKAYFWQQNLFGNYLGDNGGNRTAKLKLLVPEKRMSLEQYRI
jgi:hypothetical protein